jgi:hypothetical protein
MSTPKVFISHASEDKDRFVTLFARRLRENGVDAWLDQWETRIDDLALRVIARLQIDEDAGLVDWDRLHAEPTLQDVPQQELLDSLEILEQHHHVKIGRALGVPVAYVTLTDYGFQQFAQAYVEGYQAVVGRISALLVNENIRTNEELAKRIGKPRAFVDFVLNLLESNNYIKVSKSLGGTPARRQRLFTAHEKDGLCRAGLGAHAPRTGPQGHDVDAVVAGVCGCAPRGAHLALHAVLRALQGVCPAPEAIDAPASTRWRETVRGLCRSDAHARRRQPRPCVRGGNGCLQLRVRLCHKGKCGSWDA